MNYDLIIGLEIHTALKTESKMFCGCSNLPAEEPNTTVCPICLGHPGTLPLANRKAVEWTVLLGLALNCKINRRSKFDRKNYFYPDLPKGYQISQYDLPFAYDGFLKANDHRIDITRIHLEEDTGKLSHPDKKDYSLVDFNRAGTPLVEMVTEPVIRDAATAKAFCQRYQQILRYLSISNADMEKGEMRCEANVSLQRKGSWIYKQGQILPKGSQVLNPKVELKNINSFKSLEKAIEFEVHRQSALLDQGRAILAETRGWNDSKNETVSQRLKESSADYRYFPEPDIPPIVIDDAWFARIKSQLGELPEAKEDRFRSEYGLSEYDARTLVLDEGLAGFFEHVMSELRACVEDNQDSWERQDKTLAKLAANWLLNEYSKLLKEKSQTVTDCPVSAENFAELLLLISASKINSSAGQQILGEMFKQGGEATAIMRNLGLEQMDDEAALVTAIREVIADKPLQAAEYRAGKTALLQFFIGQVMAKTKGKANPELLKKLLQNELT